MDSFGTARQSTLDENPFADPFANRTGPTDPWASGFQDQFNDDFDSTAAFGGESTSLPHGEPIERESSAGTPPIPSSMEAPEPYQEHVDVELKSDPLDSAVVATEEEDELDQLEPPTIAPDLSKSPGFKAVSFSQTATIRPIEPEEYDPSILPHSPPAVSPPTSTPTSPTSPTSPTRIKHGHSDSVGNSSWGPLDQKGPVLERTFPNLSLGGEVGGGWGGAGDNNVSSSTWANEQGAISRFPTEQEEDNDSDDDTPIGEILRRTTSIDSTVSPGREKNGLPPQFIIAVDDPQKVGDPIRSFTMYTVHTRTSSPLYSKSAFSVLRRYSDFLWLYETLSLNNPGVVVPPVPEKNPFGRFDESFVKQRRLALENCIQKMANHPVLCQDLDLKMFLESDTFALDIKHRKAEIAHERGGLMASIGQAVVGPKFYETDEWFDKKKFYMDSLESQLKGLAKTIEFVAKQRSELAQATGEFSRSVEDLSASDIGTELSQSLAGLAYVEDKARDLQVIQSDQDMVTLMGTVDEYARLINSVRLAFGSRVRIYHNWRNAEAELVRVKQNHDRNRAQGKIPPERLSWSLSQIADAERKALDSKHEFETVSKLAKQEVARFEKERIEDFKNSLHTFLEGMIERQRELISVWENYQHMLLNRRPKDQGY